MQIDIIGVPIDLGADRRGVDMGPSAIRYAHLQNKLEELGYTVQDEGNVEVAIAETCKITDSSSVAITACRLDQFAGRRGIEKSA